MSYESIDVVYTWVNGSDPVWRKKKDYWVHRSSGSSETALGNSTLPSNTTTADNSSSTDSGSSGGGDGEDDTMSQNRYRDSEELRFSLRSLMKNAPWIRHIYLVTDNQIPYWLNLETPMLSVVTHEDIFPNKSYLPVFSSPAIEANLHRVPGLSKKFIYFNDDVFLGSPVLPDDFVTLQGAQKFYMAWEVPKCAPGCSDSWIGDGFCDRACNVSACNFDFPDCINGTNARQSVTDQKSSVVYCTKGCPDGWLADKVCDQRCKNEECGWDMGDCGIDLVLDNYPGVDITRENSILSIDSDNSYYSNGFAAYSYGTGDEPDRYVDLVDGSPMNNTSSDATDSNNATVSNTNSESTREPFIRQNRRPALTVPFGTKSVYFNLTYFPCRFVAPNETCFARNMTTFRYSTAEHDDYDGRIVHQPNLLTKLDMMIVTLFHGQEDAPKPFGFPFTVTFTVWGNDDLTGAYVSLSFRLMITEPVVIPPLTNFLPSHMGLVDKSYAALNGVQDAHVDVLKVPSSGGALGEEVLVDWHLTKNHSENFHEAQHYKQMSGFLTISLRNNSVYYLKVPFCSLLTEFTDKEWTKETAIFHTNPAHLCASNVSSSIVQANTQYQKFLKSELSNSLADVSSSLKLLKDRRKSPSLGLLLSLPMPVSWKEFHRDWIHLKLEIFASSSDAQDSAVSNEWQSFNRASHPLTNMHKGLVHDHEKRIAYISALIHWGDNSTVPTIPESQENKTNVSETVATSEAVISEQPTTPFVADTPSEAHVNDDNSTSTHANRRLMSSTSSKHQSTSLSKSMSQWIVRLLKTYLLQEDLDEEEVDDVHHRRRLLDTYASSLIHVNRMYNKDFGVETRKVPAHVPHMIDRDIMEEMQSRYSAQFNETSSHRFRSPTDMQYSFAYYYYVINRHKAQPKNIKELLQGAVDTDHDGFLNENEFRTLVSIIVQKRVEEDEILDVLTCISNSSTFQEALTATVHHETPVGVLSKTVLFKQNPSLEQVLNCSKVTDGLNFKFQWNQRLPQPIIGSDRDVVAFEMINDNFTETLSQLDSIRARQSKFICVNDNMKNPSPELEKALRQFFEAFYPEPSPFELPPNKRNPTLYMDEYRQMKEDPMFLLPKMIQDSLVMVDNLLFLPIRQVTLSLARQIVDSLEERTPEYDEKIALKRIEKDLLRNPLAKESATFQGVKAQHSRQAAADSYNLHLAFFGGILGLIAIIVMKSALRSNRTPSTSTSNHQYAHKDNDDDEEQSQVEQPTRVAPKHIPITRAVTDPIPIYNMPFKNNFAALKTPANKSENEKKDDFKDRYPKIAPLPANFKIPPPKKALPISKSTSNLQKIETFRPTFGRQLTEEEEYSALAKDQYSYILRMSATMEDD